MHGTSYRTYINLLNILLLIYMNDSYAIKAEM